MMNVLPLFGAICCLFSDVLANNFPIVRINNGTLEGIYLMNRKNQSFAAFKGIPYAKPPLGELRFEPPMPCEPWSGIRSAKIDSSMCTQRNVYAHETEIRGGEDCLYLNIYTPRVLWKHSNSLLNKYAVMVMIHGGGFITGTGNSELYEPTYLLDHDIILVTMNYRLGPLGFLSTEDFASPGNQGMKDQVQALRWVQENIEAFGGDPNKVTIFGNSAGGASTHYHMISPLSRGLFSQAISQSGTAKSSWALVPPGAAKARAEKLAYLLKCPMNNSVVLIKCLKTKDPKQITAASDAFEVLDFLPVVQFGVVIEPYHSGAFIIEDPAQSLKIGNVADVPWMVGTVLAEGGLPSAALFGQPEKGYVDKLNRNFTKLAPIIFNYDYVDPKELKNNVTMRIRDFYLKNRPIDENTRMGLVNIFTDAWFFIATEDSIKSQLYHAYSPIYYYYFTYDGSSSFCSLFGDPTRHYGTCHCDELLYLFPLIETMMKKVLSAEDYKMIEIMIQFWVNFAKYGNPNGNNGVIWQPVSSPGLEFLGIGGPQNLRMSFDLHVDRKHFWASLSPNLLIKKSTNAI